MMINLAMVIFLFIFFPIANLKNISSYKRNPTNKKGVALFNISALCKFNHKFWR